MTWPLEFQDLSPGDKQLRRQELDRYAGYAQLSVFLPLAVGILHRIVTSWSSKPRGDVYSAIPNYPAYSNKSQRSGELLPRIRKFSWWLGEDVVAFGKSWGQRDQWIVGASWGLWLLLLCVLDTHRGKWSSCFFMCSVFLEPDVICIYKGRAKRCTSHLYNADHR